MTKTALITGAAGGLGKSLAEYLTAEGWQLVVTSRDAERLKDAFGDQHIQVCADCGTAAGAKKFLIPQMSSASSPKRLPIVLVTLDWAHSIG